MVKKRKLFLYGVLFIFLYIVVLKFIFPGYVKPFVPHHSDILDYAYDWKSCNYSLASRPVGLILTYISGLMGGRYGIVVSSILCIFGCSLLIATIVCYETQSELKISNFIVYLILLFTVPSFYINYSFDIYTTYSLFIGLLALNISYNEKYFDGVWGKGLICFVLYTMCFLCKETYIISFIYFHFCKAIKQIANKKRLGDQVIYMFICIISASVALLYGKLSGSAFISANSADSTSPYYTCFGLSSVIHTFSYYFRGMSNVFVIAFLIFIVLYFKKEKGMFEVANLAVAGIWAYLPYSVLPNKVVPHYIFVAYPFLLSLVFVIKFKSKLLYLMSFCIIALSLFYNNFDNSYGYKAMSGWLKCDDNMELTLKSIDELYEKLEAGDEVLVLGLEDTTETLFRSGAYSQKILPQNVYFEVLNNEPRFCGMINDKITYVSEIKDVKKYSKIIQYGNGKVVIDESKLYIKDTKPFIKQVFPSQVITKEMVNEDGSLPIGVVGDNLNSENVKIMVDGQIKTTIYGENFISTTLEKEEMIGKNVNICLINIVTNEKSNSVNLELKY